MSATLAIFTGLIARTITVQQHMIVSFARVILDNRIVLDDLLTSKVVSLFLLILILYTVPG